MKRVVLALWLVPFALAVVLWFVPPDGDDAYNHTVSAIEQVRAWREGATLPRYQRGWNGGTGSFAPTIYSPIPQTLQGALAWLLGDGSRAVGISLAAALLATALALVGWSRQTKAVLVVLTPYVLAVALARATTTEAWALAGAAAVLPLALPPARLTRWRGLGLAVGVVLVAGCQVGMLVQLGWLLAVAWATHLILAWRGVSEQTVVAAVRSLGAVLGWGCAGLCAAAYLWLPAVIDARFLAIDELVSGPLDWRVNFLPSNSELGLLLTATAVSLAAVAVIAIVWGEGSHRLPIAAALLAGIAFSTPLSALLWHLPMMENLQFPWRFLGPTTLVAVLVVTGFRSPWRRIAAAILLFPVVLIPLRLASNDASVPTASTPEKLALIAKRQWNLLPILPSPAGFYSRGFDRIASLDRLARQRPSLEELERTALGGSWRVTCEAAGPVLLPLQWWPEWRISTAGRDLPYGDQSGLVAVSLPAGTVEINASLGPSLSRTVGAVLSSCGLVALLLLVALWDRGRGRAVVLEQAG